MTTSPDADRDAVQPVGSGADDVETGLDLDSMTDAEVREYVYRNQKKLPSPPWFGALMLLGGLGAMATILLTYTLLDWEWQQNLGGWNYVVVVALIPLVSVLMRTWQPDENL